ncbi:MAG: hypothetical protein FJX59_10390 [Alphaproteobacteria bacterium]|nr:hypothetical protein [Alphaproteobacteria bacterium]
MSDAVKYLQPPNNLRKKQIDAGVALSVNLAVLDAADRGIGEAKGAFMLAVGDDLHKLSAYCDMAMSDKAARTNHVEALYLKTSELKGQGASFGYPLLTTIGGQLCRFIETAGNDLSDAQMGVVRVHVETLKHVIQQKNGRRGWRYGSETADRSGACRQESRRLISTLARR